MTNPTKGTPALLLMENAGVPFSVHSYEHQASAASYGLEAADLLGLTPGRVFKTLIAAVEPANSGLNLVCAMVPVSHSLDLKALAQAAGGKKATMAPTPEVLKRTGYVLGAVSPLGQKHQLRTYLDASALAWDSIYCSAGRRGLELELAPSALITLLGATVSQFAKA